MRALRDQQGDESLPCNLQGEHAVELQRGGQQHDRADCFAEQMLHGERIVLVLTQIQPCLGQTHGVAANRMPFEHETTDEVVALTTRLTSWAAR